MENSEIDMKNLSRILELAWRKVSWPKFGESSWDGKFIKPVVKKNKISLCTTCMNRLEDLKQTLPKNIEDNRDYENIEFVLLDYNSNDGLGSWVGSEMIDYINEGILVYYRTEEPEYFDMSHSRNVAFLVATGDIVNNVDADSFTNEGFADIINKIANEQPEKAIFGKSKQLLRGRIGFYRLEFIHDLGGYDEDLKGYGHDDADIMNRAWELGFKFMPFSRQGNFVGVVPNHIKHQEGNYKEPWWVTEGRNRFISYTNLILKKFRANENRVWGKATLVKNFQTKMKIRG